MDYKTCEERVLTELRDLELENSRLKEEVADLKAMNTALSKAADRWYKAAKGAGAGRKEGKARIDWSYDADDEAAVHTKGADLEELGKDLEEALKQFFKPEE